MDLSTTYLGMKLRTPIVPSASPLSENIDNIKRMEDAGAAAVVLYSLFEEQIEQETQELLRGLFDRDSLGFAEAQSFLPEPSEYKRAPDQYLEHLRKAKETVGIPVIASLNGSSIGGWTSYARLIQEAGADALELNIYYIPTDFYLSAAQVERTYTEIVSEVRSAVTIPLAVKLSPYFSNMAQMAWSLEKAGADGLVLFNRFYQPDINLEALEVEPRVVLSNSHEMRLPLRWIAILYHRVHLDLAATSGIHDAQDAIKMLMAGANVTMMASALLKNGIGYIRTVEESMKRWLEEREYESVEQMRGSMSQVKCPNPTEFERAQYIKTLTSYKLV